MPFLSRSAPQAAQESSAELRARALLERSELVIVVVGAGGHVIEASARAQDVLPGLTIGAPLPPALAEPVSSVSTPEGERLLLFDPRPLEAYEELRVGFTAAVSHELRTPLARLLVLLDGTDRAEADVPGLIDQARAEIEQMRELIDDLLFLSELETGREVVALGSVRALPVLEEAAADLAESADRAGVTLLVDGEGELALPMRPRMLRMVAQNLMSNAIRYAGVGATCTISVRTQQDAVELLASDDGEGVAHEHLSRLFERFYRADHARSLRGTGLGLAIVKHVVIAAGGTVASAASPAGGLEIRCRFPRATRGA